MDELEKQAAELRAEIDKRVAAVANAPLAERVQLGGELAVLRGDLADVQTKIDAGRAREAQEAAAAEVEDKAARLAIRRAVLSARNVTVHLDPTAIAAAAEVIAKRGDPATADAAKGLATAMGAFRDAVTAFEAAAG